MDTSRNTSSSSDIASSSRAWSDDLADFILNNTQFAASSSTTSLHHDLPQLEKIVRINDHVYEVHKPSGRPSIELVFFHGLQLEGSQRPYINTWVSHDGSELWLNWIAEAYPDARIVTISYDAFEKRTHNQGITDIYITRENVVQCLTEGDTGIGQDGCPVLLVGHCIGGLVMKELCLQANLILSLDLLERRNERAQNFLNNVKGLFFYATPHHGSGLADMTTSFVKGSLLEYVTTLNTRAERQNEEFRKLRRRHGWRADGIGEGQPSALGGFRGFIVSEASARYDLDSFYTSTPSDHFSVCKPASKTSVNFSMLSNLIKEILQEDKAREGPTIGGYDGIIGLERQAGIVIEKLRETQHLAIVGMAGIGKTTLAEYVYNKLISRAAYEYTCFVREVKKSVSFTDSQQKLRDQIKRDLCFKGSRVDYTTFQWSKLRGKRVLFVFDDAEVESQVLVITQSDGFSEESRVIVTSRDRRFLIPLQFQLHSMQELDDDASNRLFCLHAFQRTNVPRGYEERVAKVTKKCGGFPLALRVAGRFLYSREEGELWNDALEKLRLAQELGGSRADGLWSILKASYDSLATSEQEMFLDIATCFYDEELEEVKQSWKACGRPSVGLGWENLVDKGLVTTKVRPDGFVILDETSRLIWMHEMLCDLGCSIACPRNGSILDHTRSHYCGGDETPIWQLNQGTPKVKVLKIDMRHSLHRDAIVNIVEDLRGLEELAILWLSNVCLVGECGSLPLKLRSLNMRWCAWREGLCSRASDQAGGSGSNLREPSAAAEELKQYSQLRHLRVARFDQDWCSDWEIEDFEDLGLPHVLATLPLDLFGGPPKAALYYNRLKRDWEPSTLPESLGQLRVLQHFRIEDCPRLKALPKNFRELQALKRLEIINCLHLQILPESFTTLRALRHLEIEWLHDLELLGDILRDLQSLEHLAVFSVNGPETVLETLGTLSVLKHLKIWIGDNRLDRVKKLDSSEQYFEILQCPEPFYSNKDLLRLGCGDPGSHSPARLHETVSYSYTARPDYDPKVAKVFRLLVDPSLVLDETTSHENIVDVKALIEARKTLQELFRLK